MQKIRFFILSIIILLFITPLLAQDEIIPRVQVSEQVVSSNYVIIDEIVATRFGFIVVRNDNGEGDAGGVIGIALLHPGVNKNIRVEIEMINVTPTLYAIVHFDTDPFGNFQFGEVDGADLPVTYNDEIVMTDFEVSVISLHDQFVDPDNFNRIVVDTVSAASDAWLVAYADDNGELGEVLGHTFLQAGTSLNLPVLLQGNVTDTVHTAIHLDTGAPERFEFGDADGIDIPYLIDGAVAKTSISTIPTILLDDQIVIGSDLTRNDNEFVPFVIDSVLSESAGWLVVQADDGENQAGDVIGFAPVQAGYNDNVIVEVPQAEVTDQLFATLHSDIGEALVFEFDTIADMDLPALANDLIIRDSASVVPSINETSILDSDSIIVSSAVIDTVGWLVLYADDVSGEILGFAPLNRGLNEQIEIVIDANALPETIVARLHYDTRPPGTFAFLTDDSSDSPVIFNDETVVVNLNFSN